MDIKRFAEKVREAFEKKLGGAYRVEVKEVRKNNGVLLHGLLILSGVGNVVPTIYLETFYAAYEDGIPLTEILNRIFEIYREETPRGSVDMEFFRDFRKVGDRICYRLIRKKDNESLLEDIPYVEFLDLAVCFYYAYNDSRLGEGSILIHNSHLEFWNVKVRDLMRCAEKNTPRLFPGRVTPMNEVLREVMEMERIPETGEPIPLAVLTNERRIHGAACILYPGMLEMLAGRKRQGFYVIPSSIHEVLLLDPQEGESTDQLRRMIYEINREHVAPEDVLSDNLYFYNPAARAMEIIF
ncbi:MAG: DUF5688 family protein [Roseburia sp.]|nr:DUF5688 family protein [Roseburia sp.]MCM1098509.1 DUF5688 family protein [Ruminococcus flavefaciens]